MVSDFRVTASFASYCMVCSPLWVFLAIQQQLKNNTIYSKLFQLGCSLQSDDAPSEIQGTRVPMLHNLVVCNWRCCLFWHTPGLDCNYVHAMFTKKLPVNYAHIQFPASVVGIQFHCWLIVTLLASLLTHSYNLWYPMPAMQLVTLAWFYRFNMLLSNADDNALLLLIILMFSTMVSADYNEVSASYVLRLHLRFGAGFLQKLETATPINM